MEKQVNKTTSERGLRRKIEGEVVSDKMDKTVVVNVTSIKIHPKYKNARFSFRHSIKQKDYFFWKMKQLEEISSKKCWWKQKADIRRGRLA